MKIHDWHLEKIGNLMDAIIHNHRMLPKNPLDDFNYATDGTRNAQAIEFLKSMLPDDINSAWETLENSNYKMSMSWEARVLIPDGDSFSGYTGLVVSTPGHAVLRGARWPIISDKQPDVAWYQWFEAQRKLNNMLHYVQKMKEMMLKMNTYGQMYRLWKGSKLLMNYEYVSSVENAKVQSRYPKDFKLPENIGDVRRGCDQALDLALLHFGPIQEIPRHAQGHRIVRYSPRDTQRALRTENGPAYRIGQDTE